MAPSVGTTMSAIVPLLEEERKTEAKRARQQSMPASRARGRNDIANNASRVRIESSHRPQSVNCFLCKQPFLRLGRRLAQIAVLVTAFEETSAAQFCVDELTSSRAASNRSLVFSCSR